MKKYKLSLLLLMLALLLSACTGTPTGKPAESTAEPTTTLPPTELLQLGKNGSTAYRIITAENADRSTENAAAELMSGLLTQADLIPVRETDSISASPQEILVGVTRRTPTVAPEGHILICTEEARILILASDTAYLSQAVALFLEQITVKERTVTVPLGLTIKKSISELTQKKTARCKAATYNIHMGGMDAGPHGYDLELLAQDIIASGADLVALQEVINTPELDQVAKLAELTGLTYHHFAHASKNERQEYGVALLSRYPITEASSTNLPKTDPAEENRVVLSAVIDIEGVELHCFVTHAQQASILLQLTKIATLAREAHAYAVLGDFNWGVYEDFHQAFADASLAIDAHNAQATTVGDYSFDNIVVPNRSVSIGAVEVTPTGHSDHHLVTASLTVIGD